MGSNIQIRRAGDRGVTETDWLESYHTFSFNRYRDPDWDRFEVLRVLNEDFVRPGTGFPEHGHSNMEILTYVIEGELRHEDSRGNSGLIHAGEIQGMSAGTGVRHSEKNSSSSDPLHLLQIWILPERENLSPSYEKKSIDGPEETGLIRIGSPEGDTGEVTVHQDVYLFRGAVQNRERVSYHLESERSAWLQFIHGEGRLNETHELGAGDGAGLRKTGEFHLETDDFLSFLLFDLPRLNS